MFAMLVLVNSKFEYSNGRYQMAVQFFWKYLEKIVRAGG